MSETRLVESTTSERNHPHGTTRARVPGVNCGVSDSAPDVTPGILRVTQCVIAASVKVKMYASVWMPLHSIEM